MFPSLGESGRYKNRGAGLNESEKKKKDTKGGWGGRKWNQRAMRNE